MIRPREELRSALVHYFSVDLDAERQTFEGVPYIEEPFSAEEEERIARLAVEFDQRFQRWLRQKQEKDPDLYCEYPQDVLFSRGFFHRGFHSCFGFTNFADITTNVDRALLYEFVREFVRELSRHFPVRWWKFDYRVLFKAGRSYLRNTTTWQMTRTESPVSEETHLFLSA